MTKAQKLSQVGVLKSETTGIHQVTQSTNAGSPSMSVTLASTAQQSPTSQTTPNSLGNPLLTQAKIIQVFAAKLGKAVEWRNITLGDGRKGYALFFDETKWLIDPMTFELLPLGELGK
jgi:hypothetical protein